MADVTIDWCEQHHTGDDLHYIQSLLGAGGDEGPLLVLPWASRGRTPRVITQIYHDVDSYIGALALDDDEKDAGERWVGLVRGSFRRNQDAALPALAHLKQLIDARPGRPRRCREAQRVRQFELTGPFASRPGTTIENVGDAYVEIAPVFPCLRKQMAIE